MAKPELDLVVLRSRLQARRAELVPQVLQSLGAEASQLADLQRLELPRGDVDTLLDRFGGSLLRELARIDAALSRIEGGRYGRCTSCGAAITVDRLLALPDATLCAECGEIEMAVAVPPSPR